MSSDKTVGLVINQQRNTDPPFSSVYRWWIVTIQFTTGFRTFSPLLHIRSCEAPTAPLKINLSPKHRVSALSWLNTNPAAVICHTEMCSLTFLSLFNVVSAAKILSEDFSR